MGKGTSKLKKMMANHYGLIAVFIYVLVDCFYAIIKIDGIYGIIKVLEGLPNLLRVFHEGLT